MFRLSSSFGVAGALMLLSAPLHAQPADLDASNVGRMIEAQTRSPQSMAEGPGEVVVRTGERHRGRQSRRDVSGKRGSGENGPGSVGRGFSQDLGHECVRAALDALGAGYERR